MLIVSQLGAAVTAQSIDSLDHSLPTVMVRTHHVLFSTTADDCTGNQPPHSCCRLILTIAIT